MTNLNVGGEIPAETEVTEVPVEVSTDSVDTEPKTEALAELKAEKAPRAVLSDADRKAKASAASKRSRAAKKAAGFTYFQVAVPTVILSEVKAKIKELVDGNCPKTEG